MMVNFDQKRRNARLLLKAQEVLDELQRKEKEGQEYVIMVLL